MTEPMRAGLSPAIGDDASVLVLGSFPSERSLADAPYEQRIADLTSRGVALWDVVHSCRRAGSMDAETDRKTLVVNDFGPILRRCPGITRVFATD